jgi:hypothetical protein
MSNKKEIFDRVKVSALIVMFGYYYTEDNDRIREFEKLSSAINNEEITITEIRDTFEKTLRSELGM